MTALDLAAIEARLQAATPGPRKLDTSYADAMTRIGVPPNLDIAVLAGTDREAMVVIGHCSRADAAFIAHAPEVITGLLVEVRRLHSRYSQTSINRYRTSRPIRQNGIPLPSKRWRSSVRAEQPSNSAS